MLIGVVNGVCYVVLRLPTNAATRALNSSARSICVQ